jgi:DNA repair exonuclease SbcCD ATPase subunit
LEKECKRNVEVMWLLKKLSPDFKTIADFRKDNADAIKKVCKEFVFLCRHLDLFGGELVAIDGSKFGAVNSKHRNFNEKKLKKELRGIEEKIEGYLRELEENDEKEFGVSSPDREELEARIEELKEKKGEYKELLEKLEDSGESQISLTDPDSRAMESYQRIEVCYNLQISVDEKNKLILDHEITDEATDNNQPGKMAKRAKEILGVEELEVLADKAIMMGTR